MEISFANFFTDLPFSVVVERPGTVSLTEANSVKQYYVLMYLLHLPEIWNRNFTTRQTGKKKKTTLYKMKKKYLKW